MEILSYMLWISEPKGFQNYLIVSVYTGTLRPRKEKWLAQGHQVGLVE